MAKPYVVSITNGVGTEEILNDTYTITSTTNGYDNASIDPSTLVVNSETNTYYFTISATGTLTLHVTESGTAEGVPIVGAIFVRCDSSGNVYGNQITTDSTGNAVFNNVPYATVDAPLIYYKQISSDGEHEFDNTLKNTSLLQQTSTLEIQNSTPALRTINLTDENYSGLPIEVGEITLS